MHLSPTPPILLPPESPAVLAQSDKHPIVSYYLMGREKGPGSLCCLFQVFITMCCLTHLFISHLKIRPFTYFMPGGICNNVSETI